MASKIKELMVEEMARQFEEIERRGCVIVGYKGFKAPDSARVRRMIASRGAGLTVVRNKLFGIAVERLGAPELKDVLEGPSAVISGEDPLQAAKAAEEVVKSCPALRVLGGYADGRVLDPAGVEKLASLPGRQALLGQVLACLCSPARRFATDLSAALYRLASLLKQLSSTRAQESSGQGD